MSQQSPGHDHDDRTDYDSPLEREKRERKRVSRVSDCAAQMMTPFGNITPSVNEPYPLD